MDGDQPGYDSNTRLKDAANAAGRATLVVPLPGGEDPASLLAKTGLEGLAYFSHPDVRTPIETEEVKAALRMVRASIQRRDLESLSQANENGAVALNGGFRQYEASA